MTRKITRRPIKQKDQPFLRRLYATTRQDEMAVVPWTEAEKEAFLDMQFKAQHTYYQQEYRKAQFDLILQDGRPIGRFYVDRRADEIRIIDIALLPEYRGRGIGSQFMNELLAEAAEKGLAVRIHVENYNPAMRLYRRLGFRHVDDNGVYHLMEWRASYARPTDEG